MITCIPSTSSPLTARGTLKSGSGLPGSHAGSLSAASLGHCSNPLFARQPGNLSRRIDFTLQARGLPWHVNLSSYNAAKGVVRGTLSHLQITASAAGCAFVVDGTSGTAEDGRVVFRYTDSTGQLTVLTTGGNLHVYERQRRLPRPSQRRRHGRAPRHLHRDPETGHHQPLRRGKVAWCGTRALVSRARRGDDVFRHLIRADELGRTPPHST